MNTGDPRELNAEGQAPSVDPRADAASELGPKNSNFPSERCVTRLPSTPTPERLAELRAKVSGIGEHGCDGCGCVCCAWLAEILGIESES